MRAIHIMCLAAALLALLVSCGGGGGRTTTPITYNPPQQNQTGFRTITVSMPSQFTDPDTGDVATMRFRYWLDYSLKLDIMPGETGSVMISCDRGHTVKVRFDLLTINGDPIEDPRPGVHYIEIGPESGCWFEPGTTTITEQDWLNAVG